MPTRTRVLMALGFLCVAVLTAGVVISTLPLRLEVRSDREAYPVGSSALIEIFLTYGPNFIRGTLAVPSVSYEVLISGPSGPVLGMRAHVHTEGPVSVSPNTTHKIGEMQWNLKDSRGTAVPPGIYMITVKLVDYPLSGEIRVQVY